MKNHFEDITPRLYKLRKESEDKFNNFFYKEMQNRSYGKMAQRKNGQEITIDSVEKAKDYIEKNYKILKSEGYDYVYQKDINNGEKNYYAPIIPALINAYARIFMYQQFEKVKDGDLLYTDTDSCIMKKGNLGSFNIGNDLGKFKIESEGSNILA